MCLNWPTGNLRKICPKDLSKVCHCFFETRTLVSMPQNRNTHLKLCLEKTLSPRNKHGSSWPTTAVKAHFTLSYVSKSSARDDTWRLKWIWSDIWTEFYVDLWGWDMLHPHVWFRLIKHEVCRSVWTFTFYIMQLWTDAKADFHQWMPLLQRIANASVLRSQWNVVAEITILPAVCLMWHVELWLCDFTVYLSGRGPLCCHLKRSVHWLGRLPQPRSI